MKLYIERADNCKSLIVDFKPQYSIKVDNLYFVIYGSDSYRLVKTENETKETRKFAEYHLKKLYYIVEGEFEFEGTMYTAQLGYFLSQNPIKGFSHILLRSYPYKPEFRSPLYGHSNVINHFRLIDVDDFNRLQEMMGLEKMNLKNYLTLIMKDPQGFDRNEKTSFFNLNGDLETDFNDLCTHKGFSIFLDEEEKGEDDMK